MKTITLAFFMAFSSLAYELLLAKAIVELIGDPYLWESLAIAAFVGGMGCGAFFSRKSQLLSTVELKLTLLGGLAVPVMQVLHVFYRIWFYDNGMLPDDYWFIAPSSAFGLICLVLPFGVGWLSGFELPKLMTRDRRHHEVLAAYYTGLMVGGLCVATLQQLDPSVTALIPALINLGVFLALSVEEKRRVLPALQLGLILLSAILFSPLLEEIRLKNYYFNKFQFELPAEGPASFYPPALGSSLYAMVQDAPKIERIRTKYQNIDIVPDFNRRRPDRFDGNYSVHIDGRFQFHSQREDGYHEGFAHIPIMTLKQMPRRVLILGGGDGLLARELLRYAAVESLIVVDIDEGMFQLAKSAWSTLNEGAFNDGRVETVTQDAVQFIREHNDKFDAIFIDFPYPFGFDCGRLYTYELFALAAAKLKKSGFMVLNSPYGFTEDEPEKDREILRATLTYSGFKANYAYPYGGHHFLLSLKEDVKLDPQFRASPLTLRHLRAERFPTKAFVKLSESINAKLVNFAFRPRFYHRRDPFL